MKSMITVLWERSLKKKQVEQRLKQSGRDYCGSENSYSFEIKYGFDSEPGHFALTDDTSLIYEDGHESDYGVYIAGNWRFEIGIDTKTGRCVSLTAFLSRLTAKRRVLELPDADPGRLVFCSNEMEQGLCDYVNTPDNAVYFDPAEKILCIGDPDSVGESVAFSRYICAVVSGGKLVSVYLDLKDLKSPPDAGISLVDCIILV